MRPLPRRTALAALTSLALTGARSPARADERPSFRRGMGVSHAFGWAEVQADGSYPDDPFGSPRFRFDAAQRLALRSAGLDFVRLAVDVGPFLAFTGSRRAKLLDRLIDVSRAVLADGLGLIIDLHPSDMHKDYRPEILTRGSADPAFRLLTSVIADVAGRLDALATAMPDHPPIALELLNEPEIATRAWQPMLEAAVSAARRGSARLPLVLGGGEMNAPDSLLALDMRPFLGDARLLYTFHDYAPWQFTHQGSPGHPAAALTAVPYPAPASVEPMWQATLEASHGVVAVSSRARQALDSYVRSGFGKAALDAPFARVAAWCDAHGLPRGAVLLGEFGAHLTAFSRTEAGQAARSAWLRDMRDAAVSRGFGWAAWTYVGPGGFALAQDQTGPGLDPLATRALGLGSS